VRRRSNGRELVDDLVKGSLLGRSELFAADLSGELAGDVVDEALTLGGELEGFGAAVVGIFLAGNELTGHESVDDAGDV